MSFVPEEKIAPHHVFIYGILAQPQGLALRPNFATDECLRGKALAHKNRGFPGRKKAIFFWEGNECQVDATKASDCL